ncbi:hypothetical protein SERLA73DRAFT_124175 [Serpula lacrymans var. lacrymans S7.3]|uniref:Transcription and mRNA export factor SUS1 n=2 Tax=Serpula lacrymans var. lacrymans TaxID=341189 RepID=F8Q2S1_SERL3|nr:uncharacterized protein SERLADRAFT_371328 [Serpula lacrymans var. lacrymans S7.9]EGN97482.1 hypothetical protein SERLA73DRAFT_124175 [Serpula lacrymans var. lacrymans S7.3]EGO23079.1 hypothetical protein SERLADRAFT_371328 [Serpula lacrymans var. lacrymans S7.9]
MTKAEIDSNVLYSQVQRRLVESGEWDRMLRLLNAKLNESGWTDDLRHRAKEHARSVDAPTFQSLLEEISPQVQTTMPLAVKRELIATIRQYVEKQFEK